MSAHSEEQHHQPTTVSARARRLVRTSLAAAVLMTGLLIGLAATANAAPDEFWECAADHADDIGVCCVFYGGDYDERTGECWIEDEITVEDAAPGGQPRPPVKPGLPVLTPAERLPVVTRG